MSRGARRSTATGVRRDLERLLRERYELTHTTLQVDHAQPKLHRIASPSSPDYADRPMAGNLTR